MSNRRRIGRSRATALAWALALALVVCGAPELSSAHPLRATSAASAAPVVSHPPVSATLEQCDDAPLQEARSVTFSGEMATLPGTVRMQIAIELQERLPGEPLFRAVEPTAPAAWRSSVAGVSSYKLMHQFTDLAAPAYYRADVRFRWLGPHAHVLGIAELRTRRCGVSGTG